MLLRRFTEQIPAIATALAVVLAVAGLSLAQPATFDSLREAVFDRFQRVAPSEITAQLPLRVVDIDEESLAQVGQWPWPRDVIATLVARLGEAGAAAIAIDILFAEPDRLDPQALAERFGLPPESFSTEGTDQRFAEAIGGAPVVLGFALARVPAPAPDLRAGLAAIGPDITPALVNAPGAVSNLPAFDAAASGLGAIAVSPADTDAVVRRVHERTTVTEERP